MAVTIEKPKREFLFDKKTLKDPNPAMSPDEVATFYSNVHPELVTAVAKKPKLVNGKVVIEFEENAGTKG